MHRWPKLRDAKVSRERISLPSEDGPAETADRLSVFGRLDYFLSVTPSSGSTWDPAFRSSTEGAANEFVTYVLAALFHRARCNKAVLSDLRLAAALTSAQQLNGAAVRGDVVSLPSDDAPPERATRLYIAPTHSTQIFGSVPGILAGDDYYVSVSPPVEASFPAGAPCFRACANGCRNPFVTAMVAALYRQARGDGRGARTLLAEQRRQLEEVMSHGG